MLEPWEMLEGITWCNYDLNFKKRNNATVMKVQKLSKSLAVQHEKVSVN